MNFINMLILKSNLFKLKVNLLK